MCSPRFTDTVHTQQPVCEVGGGCSLEKERFVSCCVNWTVPLQEWQTAERRLCYGLKLCVCKRKRRPWVWPSVTELPADLWEPLLLVWTSWCQRHLVRLGLWGKQWNHESHKLFNILTLSFMWLQSDHLTRSDTLSGWQRCDEAENREVTGLNLFLWYVDEGPPPAGWYEPLLLWRSASFTSSDTVWIYSLSPPLTVMALNHLNLLRPLLVCQIRSSLVVTSRVRAPISYPNAASCAAASTRLYATKKAKGQRGGSGVLTAWFLPLFLTLTSLLCLTPSSSSQGKRPGGEGER